MHTLHLLEIAASAFGLLAMTWAVPGILNINIGVASPGILSLNINIGGASPGILFRNINIGVARAGILSLNINIGVARAALLSFHLIGIPPQSNVDVEKGLDSRVQYVIMK